MMPLGKAVPRYRGSAFLKAMVWQASCHARGVLPIAMVTLKTLYYYSKKP